MACCGQGLGHFGTYIQADPQQYFRNTGPLTYSQMRGLGQGWFGSGQTNWISGIPNEYVVLGAGVILVLVMMR